MPIINQDNYPYILTWNWDDLSTPNPNTNSIEYKNNSLLFHLRKWDDKNYFYIEFLHGDAFMYYPLDTLMSSDTLQDIRDGKITLVLCNAHECYHSIVIWLVKDIIIKHNIPSKNVLLLTESADIAREITYVCKKLEVEPFLHETVFEFEFNAKSNIINLNDKPKTLELKDYDKKFLSFNGIYRIHRAALLAMLLGKNLLDKGFVSYNTHPGLNPTTDETYEFFTQIGHNRKDLVVMTNDVKDKFKEITTLKLDDINWESKYNLNSSLNYFYENSYFSVITETNCLNTSLKEYLTWGGDTGVARIISEKTFKAISLKHPFILLAVPKTLELLKDLGYKTFSPYIDESYDDEIDDAVRLVKVVNEVERLCNLNGEELREFLLFAQKVCEFNFNNLVRKNNFTNIIPLEKIYWI